MTRRSTHVGASIRSLCIASLAVLLASPPSALAATHLVTLAGNDAGSGSVRHPWRTIQRCVAAASPGDVCSIGSGIFAEAVAISRSGSLNSPIRVVGQPDGSTLIAGSVSISGDHVAIADLGVRMPAGAAWGLKMTGRSGAAEKVRVTTESTRLGKNNVGIVVSGSSNTVTETRVERTCFGMTLAGDGHIVSRNEVTDLRLHGECGDVDYVRVFGSNHQLRDNVLHGINRAETGRAHIDCFQTFDNNGPDRSLRNIVIDGNWCSDASQGIMFTARVHRQSSEVMVANNIFSNIGAWCALFEDIGRVRIINNTCDTSHGLHGMWCRGKSRVGSCEFKNNIFYGRGTAYGASQSVTLIDGAPSAPGRNNILYAPGRVLTGYTRDQVNVDPQFVNRIESNYRLRPSSPGRDAGVAIDDWQDPLDFEGLRRPQGSGWDIGAYEYVSAPPTSPKGPRVVREGEQRPRDVRAAGARNVP